MSDLVALCKLKDKKIDELEERLEKARTYSGTEGWPCPLCTYENGKFIKHCQMHQQIADLGRQVSSLQMQVKEETRMYEMVRDQKAEVQQQLAEAREETTDGS